MNFLFNIFNKRKESVEESNKEISLDVPKVIFNDLELHVKVGQWAEMLSKTKVTKYADLSIYTPLDAKELINKTTISKQLLDAISKEFGNILAKTGIMKDEVCIIDSQNKDDFSFNCHLENANKDVKISLIWGDAIDNFPQIIIQDENKKERYEYIPSNKDNKSRLELSDYTLYRGNNILYRSLYGYDTTFRLISENKVLQLEVSRPDYITEPGYNGYKFRLNNEDELQNYLLNLSFPVDISEVYSKIKEISLGQVTNYPTFSLIAKEVMDEDTSKITDTINLQYGNLIKFTITRGGKTVTIDKDGNWTFESSKVSIKNLSDGNIDYRLKTDSYENFLKEIKDNKFIPANEEVEKVKILSKTLFNNQKKNNL